MTLVAALRNIGKDWRGPARRLALGLSTLLGLHRRGFFVPYRYAGRTTGANASPHYGAVATILERERARFAQILSEIDEFSAPLIQIGHANDARVLSPRWDQDWFAPLDAAVAYALVRNRRPHRIVEVGSGHSTRFLLRAIHDGQTKTRLTSIDPEPRADLPSDGVDVRKATIQEVGAAPFSGLAPGDFVFIDSSHVLMPGSDVDVLVNAVLPMLPSGVFVHFHDVFLPDDYPADWRWRAYNEQSVVAALLQSGAYAPVFASHYAATRMTSLVGQSVVATLPRLESARDSSLWLVKRSVEIAPP